MNSNAKYYILTINGSQKFLVAPNTENFDEEIRDLIRFGGGIYADELRYKNPVMSELHPTGEIAYIMLKNAATLMWKKAQRVDDNWIEN